MRAADGTGEIVRLWPSSVSDCGGHILDCGRRTDPSWTVLFIWGSTPGEMTFRKRRALNIIQKCCSRFTKAQFSQKPFNKCQIW